MKQPRLAARAAPVLAASLALAWAAGARAAPASWSAPAQLGACAASGPARAAFPRDEPTHPTGRGAVVWPAAASCPQGAGTFVAPIGAGDVPGSPGYAAASGGGRLALRPPLGVAPAPHGRIAIAGSGGPNGGGSLVQGPAGGPFEPLGALAGTAGPGTLFTAYLGDVGLATAIAGGLDRDGLELRIERYFARSLSATVTVEGKGGPIESPTVSLDFRTDAILAWRQAGALWARSLPAADRDEPAQPTQRLATVSPAPRVAALISDDDRAMVAWAEERDGRTSVYLDYSGPNVRFGRPQLLERFSNPAGAPYPRTAPLLVRLSSESVMLAWDGAQDGHWVVRTAAIDLRGLRGRSTISDPRSDALLEDLQPGPRGEAIALWGEPRRTAAGGLDAGEQALLAARGIDARPGITIFGGPEQISPAGPNGEATLAIDPGSDRALALWRGGGGRVHYAIRMPATR